MCAVERRSACAGDVHEGEREERAASMRGGHRGARSVPEPQCGAPLCVARCPCARRSLLGCGQRARPRTGPAARHTCCPRPPEPPPCTVKYAQFQQCVRRSAASDQRRSSGDTIYLCRVRVARHPPPRLPLRHRGDGGEGQTGPTVNIHHPTHTSPAAIAQFAAPDDPAHASATPRTPARHRAQAAPYAAGDAHQPLWLEAPPPAPGGDDDGRVRATLFARNLSRSPLQMCRGRRSPPRHLRRRALPALRARGAAPQRVCRELRGQPPPARSCE